MLIFTFNTTIFLTSHDISDIEKLCKRVIIVNHGKIVVDDSLSNLKKEEGTLEEIISRIYKGEEKTS